MAKSICPAKRAPERSGLSEEESRETDEEGGEADQEQSGVAVLVPLALHQPGVPKPAADRMAACRRLLKLHLLHGVS